MTHRSAKKGFTLIELLVVISIIGLLASVILGSLASARVRGRDAARITDVREIKKALEFYYDDNKQYPQPTQSFNNGGAIANLQAIISPKYVGKIADVLTSDADLYVWDKVGGDKNSYAIYVYLEGTGSACKTGVNTSIFWAATPVCNF